MSLISWIFENFFTLLIIAVVLKVVVVTVTKTDSGYKGSLSPDYARARELGRQAMDQAKSVVQVKDETSKEEQPSS